MKFFFAGNNAISMQVLSVFMERLGCDGRASSGLIMNECNECGKKSCKKCDGTTDSDAIWNDCQICVLGTTGLGRDEGKDCRGICGGSYITHETCERCVPRGKKVRLSSDRQQMVKINFQNLSRNTRLLHKM